jgi:hypothetical protein
MKKQNLPTKALSLFLILAVSWPCSALGRSQAAVVPHQKRFEQSYSAHAFPNGQIKYTYKTDASGQPYDIELLEGFDQPRLFRAEMYTLFDYQNAVSAASDNAFTATAAMQNKHYQRRILPLQKIARTPMGSSTSLYAILADFAKDPDNKATRERIKVACKAIDQDPQDYGAWIDFANRINFAMHLDENAKPISNEMIEAQCGALLYARTIKGSSVLDRSLADAYLTKAAFKSVKRPNVGKAQRIDATIMTGKYRDANAIVSKHAEPHDDEHRKLVAKIRSNNQSEISFEKIPEISAGQSSSSNQKYALTDLLGFLPANATVYAGYKGDADIIKPIKSMLSGILPASPRATHYAKEELQHRQGDSPQTHRFLAALAIPTAMSAILNKIPKDTQITSVSARAYASHIRNNGSPFDVVTILQFDTANADPAIYRNALQSLVCREFSMDRKEIEKKKFFNTACDAEIDYKEYAGEAFSYVKQLGNIFVFSNSLDYLDDTIAALESKEKSQPQSEQISRISKDLLPPAPTKEQVAVAYVQKSGLPQCLTDDQSAKPEDKWRGNPIILTSPNGQIKIIGESLTPTLSEIIEMSLDPARPQNDMDGDPYVYKLATADPEAHLKNDADGKLQIMLRPGVSGNFFIPTSVSSLLGLKHYG